MVLNDFPGRLGQATLSDWLQKRALWISVVLSALLSFYSINLWLDQVFITFVHEASHGLAAVVTGGQLVSINIQPDGSGTAFTRGGFRPLILVAGYAGSCVSGAALLLAARRRGWARPVCLFLAAFLTVVTLLYVRNFFGFGVGLLLALGLAWVGIRGAGWQLSLLLSFVAVRSMLNALNDLWVLLQVAGGAEQTDAALLSQEVTRGLVPPLVFAGVILLVSLACLGAVVRWSLPREVSS